jgi:glycerol uptake facilitator-like aquaporin
LRVGHGKSRLLRVAASLQKRVTAEAIGTALLLAAIVGSGIMAERLSAGNVALALLANAIATGGVLAAVILAFGPVSGAHFNPAVSIADAFRGGLKWADVPAYAAAQSFGAIAGVGIANVMFGEPLFFASHHARHGPALLLSEFVATFGLLAVIWGCARYTSGITAIAVASYIVGAYWFTPSTSFANPAVTVARAFSDTFAGIAPVDVPPFVIAELLGALAATALFAYLHAAEERKAGKMKRSVLFVCVHNSARSQMAEAFLNARCGDEFAAESAGLEPGTLNPLVVEAMKEIGIDISRNATKSAFELFKNGKEYSYVITVCDETSAERCPVFPGGARRLHWSFPDPASLQGTWEQRLAKTRAIRDEIRAQIEAWCAQACEPLGRAGAASPCP